MPSACRFADKAGVSANQLSPTLLGGGSAAIARIEAAGATPQPPAAVQLRHRDRRHPPLPARPCVPARWPCCSQVRTRLGRHRPTAPPPR